MKKAYQVQRVPLRHNGVRFLDGQIIEAEQLEAAHAKRLLTMGAIAEVAVDDTEKVVVAVNVNGDESVPADEEPIEVTLEVNFKLDELKDGAIEQNLEFAGNISKKNLIALIIEHDKTEYFLSQLED